MDYPDDLDVQGIIVPQQVHQSTAHYHPKPSVIFTNNGLPGISIADILRGDFSVDNATDVPLVVRALRITLRILWPGYTNWKVENVLVRSLKAGTVAFTKAELARAVSRRIHQFWEAKYRELSDEKSPDWWVQSIPFQELHLVELRHVATGSWQPVISRVMYRDEDSYIFSQPQPPGAAYTPNHWPNVR